MTEASNAESTAPLLNLPDAGVIRAEADAFLKRLADRDPALMSDFKARRDLVAGTFLQSWPQSLTELSIPQVGLELTDQERKCLLGAMMARDGDEPDDPAPIRAGLDALKARLEPLIAQFPEGAFVRLGSRSPKDSWMGIGEGFRVTDAERAVMLLLDSMERIADDLSQDDYAGASSWIFVRAWRDMPKWSEFRCFMKARRLVAVTQYDCEKNKSFPEIVENAAAIGKAIKDYFEIRFRDACHLEDVVFDVFVTGSAADGFTATLLEINPYAPNLTYSGAFHWREIIETESTGETLFRYF